MTETYHSQAPVPATPAVEETRTIAIIAYALYLAAFITGPITPVVGVILAFVKRSDARGTIYQSHFSNLITVFWISVLVGVLILALVLGVLAGVISEDGQGIVWIAALPLAWIAAGIFAFWYLYRSIKGLIRTIESKPYS